MKGIMKPQKKQDALLEQFRQGTRTDNDSTSYT